jgi:hypothetical protein
MTKSGPFQRRNLQKSWIAKLNLALMGMGPARREGLADAAYGEMTKFRKGLEARQRLYVVGLPSSLGVWTQPPRMHKVKARVEGVPESYKSS